MLSRLAGVGTRGVAIDHRIIIFFYLRVNLYKFSVLEAQARFMGDIETKSKACHPCRSPPQITSVWLWLCVTEIVFTSVSSKSTSRQDWMIYRGPGFSAVVWFDSSPIPSLPPPLPSVRSTDDRTGRETSCWGEEGVKEPNHSTARNNLWPTDSNTPWKMKYLDRPLM